MSSAIIIKKFPRFLRNPHEQEGYRSLCADEKNNYFRNRLIKKFKPNKKLSSNFKRFWFCIDCRKLFSLKPIKKYKTLQQFLLQCPKCKSQRVLHNCNLTNTTDKEFASEILYSDTMELEIECAIEKFKKYHLELADNSTLQKNLTITLY
jgi:hypothetical protein